MRGGLSPKKVVVLPEEESAFQGQLSELEEWIVVRCSLVSRGAFWVVHDV